MSHLNRLQPFDYLSVRAQRNPEGILLEAGDYRISNEAALLYVKKLANFLSSRGVKRGETVALNLPIPLHILFMLASWHETAVSVAYTESISRNNPWKPDWIISMASYPVDAATNHLLIDEQLLSEIESIEPALTSFPYESGRDNLRILFSSGTTGMPKSIPLSIDTIEYRARRRQKTWLGSPNFMTLFDIGAIAGFTNFYGQFLSDATYIVPGIPEHNVRQIISNNVRHISASPAQLLALLDYVEEKNISVSLESITIGGASLSDFVVKRTRKLLSAQVYNIYGSTEGGYVAYKTDGQYDPFEMGQIFPEVEVEILDSEGKLLPADSIGIIRIKSQEVTSGYFRDKATTREFFKDGWFYPGDTGYMSKEGRLYLKGRTSELVNSAGVKIDPVAVDNYIIGKLGVIDAGSFGFIGRDGLEYFGLAVVINGVLNEDAIYLELKKQFGSHAPRTILRVDSIPRNDRGKVLRQELSKRHS